MRTALVTAAILVAFVCPAARAANEPGASISLDGDWAFAYTAEHAGAVPPTSASSATMPVPGCWDDRLDQATAKKLWPDARFNPAYRPIQYPMTGKPPDASLPYLLGTGWYRRELDVPADWQGRQVTLSVGRVVMEAWLYVNGRQVHHHLGHSTAWQVPLSPHLECGKRNELAIAVDNTRTDRIGCVIRGWQGRSAGIFGPVALRVSGQAQISDLFVWPEDDRLNWQTRVLGTLPPGAEFRWRIVDPQTHQTVASGSRAAESPQTRWQTAAQGVGFWSDREPKLYRLELELRSGDRPVDRVGQPFGRRRLTARGTQLRLNGQPIFLRGICDSAYFPATCTAPTDVAWYREHLGQMKLVGFNWLRCHTWVPPEPYLEAADELGMLIQVEPPNGYTLPEWCDILTACRRHPSVVIYCCGNEELLDEAKIEVLRGCAAELRRDVPDALFNPQEALRGVEYGLTKPELARLAQEPFPHHAGRLAALKEFSDVFGQFTWGWLSYTSLLGEPDQIDRRLAVYQRPCLGHELGICGCYLDLARAGEYDKLRIGPQLYRGAAEYLRKAGLLQRAPVYYRNSAAWQRLMLKDAMETARRSRLVAGYDCLGANDTHWHRTGYGCGVFDEFDRLKPGRTIADVLSYNGPSVLLVSDQRRRNLAWGSEFRRELFVSWFGAQPLRKAELRWALRTSSGKPLLNGRVEPPEVSPGDVACIATLDGPLPHLDRAEKLILSVDLSSPSSKITNQWDYWAFPPLPPLSPRGRGAGGEGANVLVLRTLDAPALEKVAGGARIVLLGTKPFPSRAMSFQMGLAGRPEGNLATVIARHPLTDLFPHDGYCDWQFYPMFTGAAAVQCDPLDTPFAPIIEVVSSYKQIRKQAALAEWRVGRGRLLVCSLALTDSDPAANYLRRLILDYAAGEHFQPGQSLSPELLARLMQSGGQPAAPLSKTDQGFDPRAQFPVARAGKPLFVDNFENLNNWHPEGQVQGVTLSKPGILRLDCSGSKQGSVGCMAFCRQDFPDNIAVEYDMYVEEQSGLLITFLAMQGLKGEDAITGVPRRTGIFADYVGKDATTRSYHLSVSRYDDQGRHTGVSNWRRNPGANLMASGADPCQKIRTWYHVAIVKKGPSLSLYVDGKYAHGFVDPAALPAPLPTAGKIGFRAIGSKAIVQLKNFKVTNLDAK